MARKQVNTDQNQLDLFAPHAAMTVVANNIISKEDSTTKSPEQFSSEPEVIVLMDATHVPDEVVQDQEIVTLNKEEIEEQGNYAAYQVQLTVPGARPHPTALCESLAMAAISLPKMSYIPKISNEVLQEGLLSDAQVEDLICAGNSHEQFIHDNEMRQGYMIGSGTGFGKGNTIAGIIADNFFQGRTKAIWISKNDNAHGDSLSYWTAVGGKSSDFIDHSKLKKDRKIPHSRGVLVTKYGLLKSGYSKAKGDDGSDPLLSGRIKQIVEWLGEGFDGVIAFDESHMMANAIDQKGKRGIKKSSLVAEVGLVLQRIMPKARVLYSSATGATEIQNLVYAERLGIYGPGTPFDSSAKFIDEIKKSGVSAMELVARDLKALGLYSAKSLSYQGVEYGTVLHHLTEPQRALYNELAIAWQYVLRNINEAIEMNCTDKNAKAAALSSFWSTHQRFFNLIILTMQFPSVAEDIEKHIAEGHSIIIQLTNTNEAQTKRAVAEAKGNNLGEQLDFAQMDISPKSMLIEYLKRSFPTVQFEPYIDEDGNEKSRPVVDAEGNYVHNREAVAMRETMISRIDQELVIPKGPLDTFIEHFGAENIAEVTGRSMRLVQKEDPLTGRMVVVEERRSSSHVKAEIQQFKDDQRQILIFSEAGGTGGSFHADRRIVNQRRRVHYAYQLGWRADVAVQGFGRSHRSNQVVPPIFKLCCTDINAQKRFLSSIARRLEQLGALTKGQRDTGGQGILDNSYNFESSYAKEALSLVYQDILHTASPISMDDLEHMMGLKLIRKVDGVEELSSDLLFDIKKFLNRILSLEIHVMNKLFGAFENKMNGLIKQAKSSGIYDEGIMHVKALSTDVVEELPIYTHEGSGAQSLLTTLKVVVQADRRNWEVMEKLRRLDPGAFMNYFFNKTSKKIYGVFNSHEARSSSGVLSTYVERIGVVGSSIFDVSDFFDSHESISDYQLAQQIWGEQYTQTEETRVEYHSIVKGLLLPIWHKIPGEIQVKRYIDNDGNTHLGRFISQNQLANVRYMFDLNNHLSIREIMSKLSNRYVIEMDNGFTLKQSVIQGITAVEVTNIPRSMYAQIEGWGCFVRIANRLQDIRSAYIPKNRALEVLPKMMKSLNLQVKQVKDQ